MTQFFHIDFDIGISETADCWDYEYLNNSQMGDMNSITIQKHKNGLQCIRYRPKSKKEIKVNDPVFREEDFIKNYSKCFKFSPNEFEEILAISILPKKLKNLEDSGFVIYNLGSDFCGEISADEVELDANELRNARIAFTSIELGEDGSGAYGDEGEIAAIYVPS